LELSALIPTYNFDVFPLVDELSRQLSKSNISFEIIVIDDASSPEFKEKNKKLDDLPFVFYRELNQNIGRSKIRNLLAKTAQYENLLFLDCDNQIIHPDYTSKYIGFLYHPFDVIIGGTSYFDQKPKESKYILHWKAGKFREEKTAQKRNLNPYQSFLLYNMLIKKKVFLAIPLDEQIKTYGHEDTKFGIDLENNNFSVLHIDNPVCHLGLNTSDSFLTKTNEAIRNLQQLHEIYGIGKQIKLYRYYLLLKKYKLEVIYLYALTTILGLILSNLKSNNPSLFIFDFYKLYISVKNNRKVLDM
jgi:glycosyltransferase involved in cell wall biosynthesis